MRAYIESESKRRKHAKGRFPYRAKRQIGKWARLNLYNIGLVLSDPMITAVFMFLIAGMVSALLLSKEDFVNPAIGMPVTIAVFGLGITGYNIGAKSKRR